MKRKVFNAFCVVFAIVAFVAVTISLWQRFDARRSANSKAVAMLVAPRKVPDDGSNAPREVQQLLPPQAIARFWGVYHLHPNESLIGIYIYSSDWKTNPEKLFQGRPSVTYAMLFRLCSENWKSVRHLKLTSGLSVRRMQYMTRQLWLDPKTRKRPMWVFQTRGYDEPRGLPTEYQVDAGDEVVLTFPRGLDGSYATQTFMTGFWRASDTLGQNLMFDTVDKRGWTQITTSESLNEDYNPSRISTYEWKGNKFVRVKSFIKGKRG